MNTFLVALKRISAVDIPAFHTMHTHHHTNFKNGENEAQGFRIRFAKVTFCSNADVTTPIWACTHQYTCSYLITSQRLKHTQNLAESALLKVTQSICVAPRESHSPSRELVSLIPHTMYHPVLLYCFHTTYNSYLYAYINTIFLYGIFLRQSSSMVKDVVCK